MCGWVAWWQSHPALAAAAAAAKAWLSCALLLLCSSPAAGMPVLTVRKKPGELCGEAAAGRCAAAAAAGVIGCWNDAWDSSAVAGSRGIGGSIRLLSAAVDGAGTAGRRLPAATVLTAAGCSAVAGLLVALSAADEAASSVATASSAFSAEERFFRTISWLHLSLR
jgi:hypothetical protein